MTKVISMKHLVENMGAKLFHLVGNEVPLTACGRSEIVRYYPHTGNGRHSWCLSSDLSLWVRATGDSPPCGSRLFTGKYEGGMGFMGLRVRPTPSFFILRWTTHPCILYQVCDASEATTTAVKLWSCDHEVQCELGEQRLKDVCCLIHVFLVKQVYSFIWMWWV